MNTESEINTESEMSMESIKSIENMENIEIPNHICTKNSRVYMSPVEWNPNAEQVFEGRIDANEEALPLLFGYDNAGCNNNAWSLSFDIPIMIQARWHKKERIRKKWLKRYGMKPDSVKVEIPQCYANYDTGTGQVNFNTGEIKYKFRQDQLRKGIKIEWRPSGVEEYD